MKGSLPYLVLLIEVVVFHWRVLFVEGYVIPWDLRYFHLPHAAFLAESFRAGELPLWDPFTYFGRPLWANIQVQLFYPPRLASILLSNALGGSLLYCLEVELILHVFLGGVFTFLLARSLKMGTAAALTAATIYQLGGFFASQAQHIGAVNAGAWLPLAWLSVVSMRERIHWKWVAALAFSFAMAVLSGLPALTVTVIGTSFALAVALGIARLASFRLAALTAGCAVWGLLLAAVQLIPTMELNFHSIAQYRTEWLGSGGGLPLASLVSLVLPNYYGIFDRASYNGPWEITFLYIYCSLGGLALAAAAAVGSRRRENTIFGVLTLLFGVAMMGDSTPIGRGVYELLPNTIRTGLHPEFTMPAFILGMAVLAGLGAGRFLTRPVWGYGVVAAIALDLVLMGSGRPMNTASTRAEPGISRDAFEGSATTMDKMRLLVNQTKPPGRIDTVNDSMQWGMAAPLTRIPSASGNDPMALARPIQVRLAFCDGERWGAYYEVKHSGSQILDLVNVRYLLSRTPIEAEILERANFREAADLPGRHVYENLEAFPRFFLVPNVESARDKEEAAQLLRQPSFDPKSVAIVEGHPTTENGAVAAKGQMRLVSYGNNRVELDVETPAAAYLVTSEAHYPGWRASVDGRQQTLYYTNVAFRGLPVNAGRHRVVMEFAPRILWWGAAVSAAAWAALAALCGLGFLRRGKTS